jgi:hypothetical protein
MEPFDLAKKLALVSTAAALLVAPSGPDHKSATLGQTTVSCDGGTCCPFHGWFCNAGGLMLDDYQFRTGADPCVS